MRFASFRTIIGRLAMGFLERRQKALLGRQKKLRECVCVCEVNYSKCVLRVSYGELFTCKICCFFLNLKVLYCEQFSFVSYTGSLQLQLKYYTGFRCIPTHLSEKKTFDRRIKR